MRKQRLYKLFLSLSLVLSLVIVSGCGSTRQAQVGHSSTRYEKKLTPAQERELVKEAKKWIGTKYRYGGHSRSGTDCSGMVMEVYKKVCGVKLPRSSREQRDFCKSIKRGDLRCGDLVFFSTGKSKSSVSHVGMYIGDGEIIHASSSRGVMVSSLDERYFQRTYHSSGRVLAAAGVAAAKTVSDSSGGSRSKKVTQPIQSTGEITLDEFVRRSGPIEPSPDKKAKADDPSLPSELLDDVIDQKIDSIYSGMFD